MTEKERYERRSVTIATLILVLALLFTMGVYGLLKNVSYSGWYEDLVRQTVTEMVRAEALK